MAALAESAAHIFFHREINLLRLKSKLQQLKGSEFHHNRRAAHYRYCIIDVDILRRENCCYDTDILFPLAVCLVNSQLHIDAVNFLPLPEKRALINKICGSFRSVPAHNGFEIFYPVYKRRQRYKLPCRQNRPQDSHFHRDREFRLFALFHNHAA